MTSVSPKTSPEFRQATRDKSREDSMMAAAAAINRHMLTLDPPDHTRLRALIHKAFTPKMIREFEVRIQEISNDLIDGMLGEGSGRFHR